MVLQFHIADYLVMGVFLLISLGIGVYYGLIQKQRTTEEYLLGNRQMQLFPVALSILVTYQSAISVIGVPAEVYLYDTMFLHIYLGIAVATVIQYFMIVPLVYPLRLTSTYEVGTANQEIFTTTLLSRNFVIAMLRDSKGIEKKVETLCDHYDNGDWKTL